MSLIAVTTGKAVVLPIYFKNVDGFAQSLFLNRLHQSRDLIWVILSRQGAANLPQRNLSYLYHVASCYLSSQSLLLNHSRYEFALQPVVTGWVGKFLIGL